MLIIKLFANVRNIIEFCKFTSEKFQNQFKIAHNVTVAFVN